MRALVASIISWTARLSGRRRASRKTAQWSRRWRGLMKLTRAVTHIRLCAANHAKVAALDALAAEYIALCQQYVTHFCTEAEPDGYAAPCFPSPLSQRWQRVAIQQAAGIAQSWRTNHQRAQEDFADTLAWRRRSMRRRLIPPEWTPGRRLRSRRR